MPGWVRLRRLRPRRWGAALPSARSTWECREGTRCEEGLCLRDRFDGSPEQRNERVCLGNDAYLPNQCGSYRFEASCDPSVCVIGGYYPCAGESPADSCESAPLVDVFSSGFNGRYERAPEQARHRDLFGGRCGGDGVDHVYTFTIEDPIVFRATANTPDVRLGLRSECDVNDSAFACSAAVEGALGEVLETSLEPGTYFLVADSLNDSVEGYAVAFDTTLDCACELGAVVCDGREVLACVEGPAECPVLSRQACADEQTCVEGACVAPRAGDLCTDALAIELGGSETVRVTSLGFGDDTAASCGAGGADAVHAVVVEEPSRLEAAVVGEPGLSLSLRGSCGDAESELACAAGGQTLSAEVEAGTYFIWVEGVTQDYTLGRRDAELHRRVHRCRRGAVRRRERGARVRSVRRRQLPGAGAGHALRRWCGVRGRHRLRRRVRGDVRGGETRCDGETVEECVVDESGCTAFVTMDVCSVAGCSEGACVESGGASLCEDGSAPPCEELRDAASGGCAASGRAPAATWALLIGLGALVRRRM